MGSLTVESEPVVSQTTRDTIYIMGDVFPTEQLDNIVNCLSKEGHRCAIFEGVNKIRSALVEPRSKLLYLGASGNELPHLIETIQSDTDNFLRVPVLVHLKEPLLNLREDLLVSDINDFVLEPLNLHDMCLRVRRLAQVFSDSCSQGEQVRSQLMSHFGMRQFIVKSPSFLKVVAQIPRVAACNATVLLRGQTGTGKEMCARAIHYLSDRAKKPFVPVNCGSIPAELFENEMFGYEPGAFTDARRSRRGLIAEADGGTLFLDEIDSLVPSSQVKLLRFLQDHQYKPLGTSHYKQADVRLIAACNQDLEGLIREGTFREDLYYRLKIVMLQLPALCDRREDVLPLAWHFLEIASREYNRPVSRFSPETIHKLLSYTWPGNVRELENVVRQAVVLSDGPLIKAHHIRLPSDTASASFSLREPFKVAKARVIEVFERSYLLDLISVCNGNISMAAREAKKNRRAFHALLKKHGISSGSIRAS